MQVPASTSDTQSHMNSIHSRVKEGRQRTKKQPKVDEISWRSLSEASGCMATQIKVSRRDSIGWAECGKGGEGWVECWVCKQPTLEVVWLSQMAWSYSNTIYWWVAAARSADADVDMGGCCKECWCWCWLGVLMPSERCWHGNIQRVLHPPSVRGMDKRLHGTEG